MLGGKQQITWKCEVKKYPVGLNRLSRKRGFPYLGEKNTTVPIKENATTDRRPTKAQFENL